MSLCFEAIQTPYWQRRLDAVSASAPLTDRGLAFLQALLSSQPHPLYFTRI